MYIMSSWLIKCVFSCFSPVFDDLVFGQAMLRPATHHHFRSCGHWLGHGRCLRGSGRGQNRPGHLWRAVAGRRDGETGRWSLRWDASDLGGATKQDVKLGRELSDQLHLSCIVYIYIHYESLWYIHINIEYIYILNYINLYIYNLILLYTYCWIHLVIVMALLLCPSIIRVWGCE